MTLLNAHRTTVLLTCTLLVPTLTCARSRADNSPAFDASQALSANLSGNPIVLDADLALAWGLGDQGQLGDGLLRSGSPYGSSTPVSVTSLPGGRRFISVAGGNASSLALASDGTLWAWGGGVFGQLGNGGYTGSTVPVAVNALPDGRTVVAISAGHLHNLVLAGDGTLWTWGYGQYGQLGDGTFRSNPNGSSVPVQVTALPGSRKAVAIVAGGFHNLALADDATLWSWGNGAYGQLGDGTFRTDNPYGSSTPVPVTALPGGRMPVAIAAGQIHSLALADDGTIWAWGAGENGQLGDGAFRSSAPYGSNVPVLVNALPGAQKVIAITAGAFHNLALAEDGTLWSWGFGKDGELGDGTYRTSSPFGSSTPVPVSPLPGGRIAVEIDASYGSLALANDGSIWTWGNGYYGQLGDGTFRTGTTSGASTPVQVIGLPANQRVLSVTAGTFHNFALLGQLNEPSIFWASPDPITYGTPLTAAQLNATATYNGIAVSGSFTYSPPLGAIPYAGADQTLSVTFTPTDASVYTPTTASVKIDVLKAPLTIIANDQFKPYSGLMPPLTLRYEGFVNGDSAANLLSQPVISTTATQESDFGQYPISVSGASSPNYAITYVSGSLTVYWLGNVAGPVINPDNNHRYYLLDMADWFASEAAAQLRGGHLVTIRSQEENDYVYNTFGGSWLWTGLYDPDKTLNSPDRNTRSTEFSWTSGEPLSYTRWYPGEPNNYNGLGEFYGLMVPTDLAPGGYWNDAGAGFWANGVAEVPPPSVIAGPIVNPANGHEYYLLDSSDWVQSEAVAQTMGGHLATIRNPDEQSFVYSNFANFNGVPRHLYIGLFDANRAENSLDQAQRKAEFAWVSGEPVTYQNWAAAEPNNFQRAGEFWVHMLAPSWQFEGETLTGSGEWNDIGDASTFGAPMNAVVEIIPPNHSPTATDQSFIINESTSIGITLVNFGSDPEGGPLTYAIVEQPLHGSLFQSDFGVAYTPTDGYTGTDSFKFKLIDLYGAESAPAQITITVQPLMPEITSLSPDSRLAGAGAFTLAVQGRKFIHGVEVLWNGSPRPTTYGSFGYITAEIPSQDLTSTPDLTVVQVTVRNPGGASSLPLLFTIKNPAIGATDSSIAPSGGFTTVSTAPTSPDEFGLNAMVNNPDGDPVIVSAAVYSDTPPSGLVIDAGGSYYDLKVSGADAYDSLSAKFYYPASVTGSAENKLRLTFFNGTTWLPVRSSGNTNPLKDPTNNLDQTISGGRFSVVFDNSSAPKITELSGTVFGLANTTPTVAVSGPAAPLLINSPATIAINYTAIGGSDSQEISVNWGDGSVSAALADSSGHTSADHSYSNAGVYTVRVAVTDANGDTGFAQFEYIVVYDPSGGFVVGGGWIHSPAGAYSSEPSLSGRANFGFTARYAKGATVPTGQTQFQFQLASLNFHSTAYEWLVVSGARAQYKGSGTINGTGNYAFILTAIDGQLAGGGGADKMRIKIWENTTGAMFYDNQAGAEETAPLTTTLGGGSVTIQK